MFEGVVYHNWLKHFLYTEMTKKFRTDNSADPDQTALRGGQSDQGFYSLLFYLNLFKVPHHGRTS